MNAEGVAWVTGAGRGLGRALALELAGRGFQVRAGMREPRVGADLPDLGAQTSGEIQVEELDVTRPETLQAPEGLRVLVNNAGQDGSYLPVEHAPTSLWRDLFETNFFGLLAVTQRAVPALREAGGGVICNITSCSTLQEVPFYGAYRASKAAAGALGETLRAEVAPFGIRVLEVMPGPIETEMLRVSDRLPEAAEHPGYRELAEELWRGRRGVADLTATPEAAAARIANAILDDEAPARVGCDPLSDGMLAAIAQS